MAEAELEYVLRQQGGVRGVQELRVVRRMNQKYLLCQKDLRIFVNLHQHKLSPPEIETPYYQFVDKHPNIEYEVETTCLFAS